MRKKVLPLMLVLMIIVSLFSNTAMAADTPKEELYELIAGISEYIL